MCHHLPRSTRLSVKTWPITRWRSWARVRRGTPHTFILMTRHCRVRPVEIPGDVAPGMDCISAEQEELLARFVYNGGTLFLTGEAGTLDPYGEPRANRAFHSILTDKMLSEAAQTDFVATTHGKGRIVYASKKHAINEYAASIGNRMVRFFLPIHTSRRSTRRYYPM